MRPRVRTTLFAAGAAIVVAGMFVGAGVALKSQTVTASGRSVTGVNALSGTTNGLTINSTTFADIPGAVTTVVVPAGTRGLIVARFSAESACFYGQPEGINRPCYVRILIGGTSANPAGDTYVFDWDKNAINAQNFAFAPIQSLARDGFRGPLAAGTYTVRAQWRVSTSALRFRINRWSLIVERVIV